jgi:hypothetical protein
LVLENNTMIQTLLLSSLASGLITVSLVLLLTYLPVFWRGNYYDILTSLGGALFKRVTQGSRLSAALFLFATGILLALAYAWFTLQFIQGWFPTPTASLDGGLTLFYPVVGAVLGLGQGVLVALLTTFAVTTRQSLESYREGAPLVQSYLVGNTLYGAVVMTCHSLLLPLLLRL